MNDIMNVWMMLWHAGVARYSHEMTFLNVDSFNLGHNHHDGGPRGADTCVFYETYRKNYHAFLKGASFGSSTVCIQRVLMQPSPPKFFVWGNWFKDHYCSFVGPSALYQRWNMHVRHSYGLLGPSKSLLTNQRIQVR